MRGDLGEADGLAWVTCFCNGSGVSRGVKGDSERKGSGVGGATDVDIAGGRVGNTKTSSCLHARQPSRLGGS